MSESVAPPARDQRIKLGELRPSQLLFAFGVGAIVDLPHLSVMVMGLDDWDVTRTTLVTEPRLLDAVRQQLGSQVRELRLPPRPSHTPIVDDARSEEARIGVPVATFPRWLVCTRCRKLASLGSGLFRLDPDQYRPDRTRYVHENCSATGRSKAEVLPVRFLMACERGHLDDFPWMRFVHYGETDCRGDLFLRVRDASGEAAGLLVSCRRCGKNRVMAQAFGDDAADALGACSARRPQLRDHDPEPCTETPRTILLGASNVWFPKALSALSIPTKSDPLEVAVESRWAELAGLPSRDGVTTLRLIGRLQDLSEWSDDQVWAAIEAHRAGADATPQATSSLRLPEWDAFTNEASPRHSPDFQLRPVDAPAGFETTVKRVVLVERLREVRALMGFTRISPLGDFGDSTADQGSPLAPLTRRAPEWAVASEVRGEGLFVELAEPAIETWLASSGAKERLGVMLDAHRAHRERYQLTPVDAGFPGLRFMLLHSLAHALMRQLSVECGYTLASIRERIYARDADEHGPAMAGLLLYTAAPDSEGTLGGLVRLGEPQQFGRLLGACLHEAEMCSSDPLCAEHDSSGSGHDLHAAACHACLFVPETSCERSNRYLDRAVLAPVFGHEQGAFFEHRT